MSGAVQGRPIPPGTGRGTRLRRDAELPSWVPGDIDGADHEGYAKAVTVPREATSNPESFPKTGVTCRKNAKGRTTSLFSI